MYGSANCNVSPITSSDIHQVKHYCIFLIDPINKDSMPTKGEMKADSVEYLQSLTAVRERCAEVLERAKRDGLQSFRLDLGKMSEASEMIKSLIIKDYGPIDTHEALLSTLQAIPPHGRWRHFGNDNIEVLIEELRMRTRGDQREVVRSLLDLFVVGVLVDAGAGDAWRFTDPRSGKEYRRSEGLAVAALRMFLAGGLSSAKDHPWRVDTRALKGLHESDILEAFQVSENNHLLGVEGRLGLLQRLGSVLEAHPRYFPPDSRGVVRPGALLDCLTEPGHSVVHIDTLWELVIKGFGGIWPESRRNLNGTSLGDVWPCEALPAGYNLVPFHKLSQWLTYSLMEPMQKILGIQFVDSDRMTGLAEYRNGGFFVDLGVITLKQGAMDEGIFNARKAAGERATSLVPLFAPESQVVIEWRALTVALIDLLAESLRQEFGVSAKELPLPKILEAGTWKAGRILGRQLRPHTEGGPPLAIISDGTLF